MAIITCISPKAKSTAQKYARLEKLQRQIDKIEEDQSLALIVPFSDRRFFKKALGRDYRILFSRHIYEKHTLLCVFSVMSRGNRHYDTRWKEISVGGNADHLYQKIEEQNKALFDERLRRYRYQPMPPPPPEPNNTESLWLTCGGRSSQHIMVYETQAWIDAHKQEHFIRSGNAIYHLLEDIYSEIDQSCKYSTQNRQFFRTRASIPYVETSSLEGDDFKIFLQYFPAHQLLFLLDLTKKDNVSPAFSFTPDTQREILIKNARRAYPLDVFLLDADDFASIQKQEEGNLALSPEEADILNQVNGVTNNRFPLFINGRAGSGKSTILQYLLKDYLYLAIEYWDEKQKYTPLYLTYSKKLLDSAHTHLDNLLASNAKVLLEGNEKWKKNYHQYKKEIFKCTFKLFQELMIELLPEESRPRFVLEHFMGYAQFKQLWERTRARGAKFQHRYSADLVWHVFRTYIKGMSDGFNTCFTPEEYKTLPTNYKTISDTDFNDIYHTLWEGWYRPHCEKYNLWDEQDLALTVLAEANFPQTYPAIFCDEAQDFTVIELKILYYLSVFSERTVESFKIGHVPFILAGDPLQTLNPTGFRWEAVKSSFHNYLVAPIERRTRSKNNISINYQELLANYRSSKKIVDFCNYIQLLRLCLFSDSYHIQAQTTWFTTEGMTPFLYSVKAAKAQELLEYNALVIIPNCHENEEAQYVKNDPLLEQVVDCDEEDIPSTVLSPTMAKGLEYDEIVVLYRFGATCPPSLLDHLQGRGKKNPGPAVTIEWEYFLNRLYVAVSRAKQRLVILDDPDTFQTFWSFMQNMDSEHLVEHLDATVNPQDWGGDKILIPKEGHEDDIDNLLQGRRLADDTAELADKYYCEGIDTENAGLLRRARMQYQRLNNPAKAQECYAHALRLEAKYQQAAMTYLAIDDQRRALDCLWQAKAFNYIAENNWGETRTDVRIALAKHLEPQKQRIKWVGTLQETDHILKRIQSLLLENRKPLYKSNHGWSAAITALLHALRENDDDITSLNFYWQTIIQLAKHFAYEPEHLAVIAYHLQHFKEARTLWEKADKVRHELYYRSVYADSKWPESLRPLRDLQDFAKIISEWQDRGKSFATLDESLATIVIEAMIKTGKFTQATGQLSEQSIIVSEQLRDHLATLLWQQIRTLLNQSTEVTTNVIGHYLVALVNNPRKWHLLESTLNKIDMMNKLSTKQHHIVDQCFIEQLAYNPSLSTASGESLDILSKLLKQRFWKKGEYWLTVIEREISISVAGAAIERANRLSDAIDFYKWLARQPRLRSESRYYFDARLAACMQKMINWKISQGLLPTVAEEDQLADLKKRLERNAVFFELEPNPDDYPNDGVLPPKLVNAIREAQQPVSSAESNAKKQLKQYSPAKDEKKWLETLANYVEILAEQDKWHMLAKNWCQLSAMKQRYPNSRQRKKALDTVVKAIVELLAVSDKVLNNTNTDKKNISNLLIDCLKDKNNDTWSGCDHLDVDYEVIGACLERVGLYKDAIQFYDWRLNEGGSRSERKFMAERLIAVQERYVMILINSSNIGKHRRGKTLQKEATQLRKKYRMRDRNISLYPDI